MTLSDKLPIFGPLPMFDDCSLIPISPWKKHLDTNVLVSLLGRWGIILIGHLGLGLDWIWALYGGTELGVSAIAIR